VAFWLPAVFYCTVFSVCIRSKFVNYYLVMFEVWSIIFLNYTFSGDML
jgi:hypothetical protein